MTLMILSQRVPRSSGPVTVLENPPGVAALHCLVTVSGLALGIRPEYFYSVLGTLTLRCFKNFLSILDRVASSSAFQNTAFCLECPLSM